MSPAASSASSPTGPGSLAVRARRVLVRSRVYLNGWARKHELDKVNSKIYCLYPGCPQWCKSKFSSTTHIRNHLLNFHRINENDKNEDRPEFLTALTKFITSTGLPAAVVQNPHFQHLLNVAQSEPLMPSSFQNRMPLNFMRPFSSPRAPRVQQKLASRIKMQKRPRRLTHTHHRNEHVAEI